MKNRFFNYFLALILIIGLYYKAGAQNNQAEAKLQQYTIRIGDQTKLFLSVRQQAKDKVNFPKFTDTIAGKVELVSMNKPDTVYAVNNRNSLTVTQSYTITCFDAGTYTIPPLSIGTAGGGLKTNELTLLVETVKVDTTKDIYDIKRPLAVNYTIFDWLRDNWYLVVFPLLGLALIIALIIYVRKHPKIEPAVYKGESAVLPHIVALQQLKELGDKKLWQQDEVKQYYIELSDIIREYIEKRYVVKTHEKTTDEIFAGLKYMSINDDNRNKLRQILVLADLVKFAKERPLPVENEQSMEIAIDFVVNTQQAEQVTGIEGGKAYV